jgi:phosphoribosyl-AMP cyclohydrolase
VVIVQQMPDFQAILRRILTISASETPKSAAVASESTAAGLDDAALREQGTVFLPRFDAAGLVTAVAVDHATGRLLMLAHMNAEAIAKTQETGFAHFHSRSRGQLWMKGESSGHVLKVIEIRVDCDQDALELRVEAAGPACHTLAPSCFYRRLDANGGLERLVD